MFFCFSLSSASKFIVPLIVVLAHEFIQFEIGANRAIGLREREKGFMEFLFCTPIAVSNTNDGDDGCTRHKKE